MPDFETIRDAKNDLVLSNQHFAVLFDSSVSAAATSLEDPADGNLLIPVGAEAAGIIEKGAGVSLAHDITSTDIEGYGEADPVRTIISKRSITFEANFLETNKTVLEKFWGTVFDESNLTVSATGGVVLEAPALPKNVFYRAYLVGLDDVDGKDLYTYYIMPRVKLTNVANQDSMDDGAISYQMTFQAFRDSGTGFSVAQGWCGPGWRSLVHKTGFVAPATSITLNNTTATVTAATGATHTKQLVVTGSNGINYTPDCQYESSAPSKATVSSSGLITGVSAGSANITVTYNGVTPALTATVAVTVS